MKRKTDQTRRDRGTDAATAEPARAERAARATVAVCAAEPEGPVQRQAALLAARLGLPLIPACVPACQSVEEGDWLQAQPTRRPRERGPAKCPFPSTANHYDLLLTVTAERLELRFPQRGGPGPLVVDFVGGPLGYGRRVNRFGLLYQAVGFRGGRPTVLDATAGLGRDAFRLAYHGCRVTAIERSPILFALLQDGLERAARVPEIQERLGDRLHLLHADARDVLQQLASFSGAGRRARVGAGRDARPTLETEGEPPGEPRLGRSLALPRRSIAQGDLAPQDVPDVVYLDPMFPPQKKSALVKVELRILRRLVGDDPDAGELFELARAVARQRAVVKRHRHAEPLAPHPTHSHSDKTTRYDVYISPPRP